MTDHDENPILYCATFLEGDTRVNVIVLYNVRKCIASLLTVKAILSFFTSVYSLHPKACI